MAVFDHQEVETIDQEVLVPIAGTDRILVSARRLDSATADDQEIAGWRPSFDELFDSITVLARGAVVRLQETSASKVTVELGCEFGIESGKLIAVVGKATGKSAFKIGLEWSTPHDPE